ncbi:MAG: hypothetical protein Q9M28_01795 [Mariprofundaceae bacterium]|nr:hypothetical protein [Mariprofundaceae bacterium]
MNSIQHQAALIVLAFILLVMPMGAIAGDLKQADYSNAIGQEEYKKKPEYKAYKMPSEPFQESWFTGNKAHMYLGLGSLLAAGVAGMTAPDSEGAVVVPNQPSTSTTHAYAAKAAAALGGAAVVSGLWYHFEDITLDDGIMDPDMLHMLLGIAGTAAYVYAISKAPKVIGGPPAGHAAAGIAGAGLMFTGIVLEW